MTAISQQQARAQRGGFTLVEAVAALAIASVIILATAGLIHNVALHFDRGTRGVNEAERIVLAIDRLSDDFGAARFVARSSAAGSAVAFSAERANADGPAKVTFVSAAGIGGGAATDEVVVLTLESDGDLVRLVRRRAPWLGPRTSFETLRPGDPVVLLEGRFDISFVFGRVTTSGALSWQEDWVRETVMPRFVRLVLRDRETRSDLLAEADLVVHADAPARCVGTRAVTCLSVAPAQTPTQAQAPPPQPSGSESSQ